MSYSPVVRAAIHGRRAGGKLDEPDLERTVTVTVTSGSDSEGGGRNQDTPRKRYKYDPNTGTHRLAKPSTDSDKLDGTASGASTPLSFCTERECYELKNDVHPDTMTASSLRPL